MGKETGQEKVGRLGKKIGGVAWRYGINYGLLIMEIVAITVLTVMSVGFDGWAYLLTPSFIITTIILFLIYTASHWTMFNLRIKKLRAYDENKQYIKEQESTIKKTTTTVEWVTHKAEFLSNRKVSKKREAWKIHIQNKLTKLERKAPSKQIAIEESVITDFQRKNLSPDDLTALQARFDEQRRNNPYSVKKRLYEQQLTDKWIAENINRINIDFDDVNSQFIETGSMIKGQEKTKTEERGKYTKDNSASRLTGLLFTAFISAFTIDLLANWKDGAAWIQFALRMTFLLVNVIMGLDYADGFYRDVDVHNVDNRVSVCSEFWVWNNENYGKGGTK